MENLAWYHCMSGKEQDYRWWRTLPDTTVCLEKNRTTKMMENLAWYYCMSGKEQDYRWWRTLLDTTVCLEKNRTTDDGEPCLIPLYVWKRTELQMMENLAWYHRMSGKEQDYRWWRTLLDTTVCLEKNRTTDDGEPCLIPLYVRKRTGLQDDGEPCLIPLYVWKRTGLQGDGEPCLMLLYV